VIAMSETGKTPDRHPGYRRETLEEQARRKGIRPIESVEDLARDDIFETDEELDEFLVWLYAERRRGMD
jgi:hypothetical protein